jgi:hypothetical protein
METEGIAVLVGFQSDHNVCDECKKRKEATTAARKTVAALVQLSTGEEQGEEPQAKRAKADAEVKRCEALEAEHQAETRKHNAFISAIQIECERQARLALDSGSDFTNVPHAAFEDDKTSVAIPSVPLDTSLRASETHNVHGVIDVSLQEATLSSTETGAGAKDAHTEIDLEVPLAQARARAIALTLSLTLTLALPQPQS